MNCHRQYHKQSDGDAAIVVYRLHANQRIERAASDHNLSLKQEMYRIVKLLHKDISPLQVYDAVPYTLNNGVLCVLIAFRYQTNSLSTLERRLQLLDFEQVVSAYV